MSDVIERVYRPRGAALEVFRRREPKVLIAGPAGTGGIPGPILDRLTAANPTLHLSALAEQLLSLRRDRSRAARRPR